MKFQALYYAPSSQLARKTQVKHYLGFIADFGGILSPIPCDTQQVCIYVAYMARSFKYSSIRQYLSGINNYFKAVGSPLIDYDSYPLKSCLRGVLRSLGGSVREAAPLLPRHLLRIFSFLHDSPGHAAFRAAVLLSFRALLRKCQVTESESTIRRCDVDIHPWGMLIRVRRSKTIQFGERVLQIPVSRVPNTDLCAVFWLEKHIRLTPAEPDSHLFRLPGSSTMPYRFYQGTLKLFCKLSGLDPDLYSSHSLRRGGATYLSMSGARIEEIKARGDWASSCVYRYLRTPLADRIVDDIKVANVLAYTGE